MEVRFVPRDIVEFDGVRIIFKNLRGEGTKYNREGERNFAIRIYDEDIANALKEHGWNVRIKPPRDEEEEPFMYLPVKVKFNERGPHIYLVSGRARTKLNKDTVAMIDDIDIDHVNLDIRPYDWEVQGKNGRTAYLQSMEVVQEVDRFAARDDEAIPFE